MDRRIALLLLTLTSAALLCSVWSEEPVGEGESVKTAKPGTNEDSIAQEETSIKLDGMSVAEIKQMRERAEKHAFEAEVDRMMGLIINSLYRNKEIFLRELISNASDALDKLRLQSVTDPDVLGTLREFHIKIKPDPDNNSLHIIDSGIGMTKKDLITNLGTVAKSGTADFMEKMTAAKSATEASDLIGQFGVGFYSAFLVSDSVTVVSKHNDDDQYIWESDTGTFTVVKDPRGNTLQRGTEVILKLKKESADYLKETTLTELIKKYSQFINFPIYLYTSTTKTVEEKVEDVPKEESTDEDAVVEEEKEKKKTVEKTVWDWQLVNANKPIWLRKPSNISDSEYNSFFYVLSKTHDPPLAKIHFTAEGEVNFKSILYVPSKAPHNMFKTLHEVGESIKLYVRRVFITSDFKDLMPAYLKFIIGIVDSDDLPLNISRETLQQSKLVKVIRKKLVRKAIAMISKLSEEDYEKFWQEFGTNIKIGVMEDESNRTRLASLLRFFSSHATEKATSLDDYVSRMKPNQKQIFYLGGDNMEKIKKSPYVEGLLSMGYEVLYCRDPIDEYTLNSLPQYDGKAVHNAAKIGGRTEEDDSEQAKERLEAWKSEYHDVVNFLQLDLLTDRVYNVTVTDRLTTSPCVLMATSWGYSSNMERIVKSQAYRKVDDGKPDPMALLDEKKFMYINPLHPFLKKLKTLLDNGQKEEQSTKDFGMLLYENAVLRSGYDLPDPIGFVERVENLLRSNLDIPLDEKPEKVELDDEGQAEPPKVEL